MNFLTSSQEWFEAILYSIDDAFIVTDLEKKIIFMNSRACRLTGYDFRDRFKINEIFHIVDESSHQSLEDPVDLILREEGVTEAIVPSILISREGYKIPIDCRASLACSKEGKRMGVALFFRDISERHRKEEVISEIEAKWKVSMREMALAQQATLNILEDLEREKLNLEREIVERKRITEALRSSEELHRQIVETAYDAFIGMDENGTITAWNNRAETIFGWSRKEALGKSLTEIILPPGERKNQHSELKHFLKTGEGFLLNKWVEMTALHQNGSAFSVELTIWPVRSKEKTYFNAFVHDISERKRLGKMKDEFISNVSHEMRTPLTIIKGSLENIKIGVVGELTPAQTEVIDAIFRSVNRLARIINDTLDLSRLESGRSIINRCDLKPNLLVQEVIHNFEKTAQESSITLIEDLSSLPHVSADPDLIIQVLTNLISNAIRFGKTKVIVTGSKTEQGVKISVVDDGLGISEEDQKKIFNKFEQLNRPAGGEGYKGTGHLQRDH